MKHNSQGVSAADATGTSAIPQTTVRKLHWLQPHLQFPLLQSVLDRQSVATRSGGSYSGPARLSSRVEPGVATAQLGPCKGDALPEQADAREAVVAVVDRRRC